MSSWKWLLLSFFGGAISFWISDIIIAALDPNEQGYAVTVMCPIVLIVFYVTVLRLRKGEPSGPSTAIFGLCGMWILALTFILLASRLRGSGGMGTIKWNYVGYILVSSFIPTRIYFFVMLEGSIIALFVGTFAMIICHLVFERTRWVVPPSLWAMFQRAKL